MVCQFYHTIYLSQIIIIYVSVIYLLKAFLICSHTHADIFAGFACCSSRSVSSSKLERFYYATYILLKRYFITKWNTIRTLAVVVVSNTIRTLSLRSNGNAAKPLATRMINTENI